MKNSQTSLALVLLVLLAFALGCVGSANQTNSGQEVTLKAQAKISGNTLTITNLDKFTYSKPNALIHQGWGGYSATLQDIEPGKSVRVLLSSFTDTDNQRFNVYSTKVRTVTLECTVDGKKAYVGWNF